MCEDYRFMFVAARIASLSWIFNHHHNCWGQRRQWLRWFVFYQRATNVTTNDENDDNNDNDRSANFFSKRPKRKICVKAVTFFWSFSMHTCGAPSSHAKAQNIKNILCQEYRNCRSIFVIVSFIAEAAFKTSTVYRWTPTVK